jgi:hypothetical protein
LEAPRAVFHDGEVRDERKEDPMLMTKIDMPGAAVSPAGSALSGIICAG